MFFHKKKLLAASERGDLRQIEDLLAMGVDVNARAMNGITALMVAARCGQNEVVRLLMKEGANPDIQDEFGGRTALMFATIDSHQDTAGLLIDCGADIDIQNHMGETALMIAALRGDSTVAGLLLEKGADTALQTREGDNALHLASEMGHPVVVRLLLEHGAEVDASDSYGGTALMHAVFRNSEAVVLELLRAGANIDDCDIRMRTSLMYAAESGQTEMVRLLLDRDASLELKDEDGWTALTLAARNEREDVCELLRQRGARHQEAGIERRKRPEHGEPPLSGKAAAAAPANDAAPGEASGGSETAGPQRAGFGKFAWGAALGAVATSLIILAVLLATGGMDHDRPYGKAVSAGSLSTGDAAELLGRAYSFYETGRYSEAVALLGPVLEADPGNFMARYIRGASLLETGDLGPSEEDLAEALRLEPSSTEVLLMMARLRQANDDHAGAETLLDRVLEIEPDFSLAYYYRGISRNAGGRKDSAIEDYRRAARLGVSMARQLLREKELNW